MRLATVKTNTNWLFGRQAYTNQTAPICIYIKMEFIKLKFDH